MKDITNQIKQFSRLSDIKEQTIDLQSQLKIPSVLKYAIEQHKLPTIKKVVVDKKIFRVYLDTNKFDTSYMYGQPNRIFIENKKLVLEFK